jgi:hypothetical protein
MLEPLSPVLIPRPSIDNHPSLLCPGDSRVLVPQLRLNDPPAPDHAITYAGEPIVSVYTRTYCIFSLSSSRSPFLAGWLDL